MTFQTPADVQLGMVFQIRPGFNDWWRSVYPCLPPFAEGAIVEATEAGYETIPGPERGYIVCARVRAVGTSAVGLVPVRFLSRRKVTK